MSLTLLVLAAGMGSRYGGLKQLEPVGPSGETLLDYAVFSARTAGFSHVVFVIRQDFEAAFRDTIGRRYEQAIAVDYVFQSLAAIPPGRKNPEGRVKPWGTGHAVWCARDAVGENFAVINADDFYGARAFALLANFLSGGGDVAPLRLALVGFHLRQTLSEHGAVARGVCRVAENGELLTIVEAPQISRSDVGAEKLFSGQEIVSMNCWGFTPGVFALLEREWQKFWDALTPQDELRAEFYLPTAIGAGIAAEAATVKVLSSDEAWFGLTYPDDAPGVRAALCDLVRAGKFPGKLF